MQTKQKWALTLLTAWGAMSCGGSAPVDTYQGVIDGTALAANYRPPSICGTDKKTACTAYQPSVGSASQETVSFYNLGFYASTSTALVKDAAQRVSLPVSQVKTSAYEIDTPCTPGKAFDVRTDAYREDAQYPIFDALPLAPSSTSTPQPPPLVAVKRWTDLPAQACNAIKSDETLLKGTFGGSVLEGQSYALRAVINIAQAVQAPANNPGYEPASGWYRGLQLTWLDGGSVGTELIEVPGKDSVSEVAVFQAMDGVQVKAKSTDAAPEPSNASAVLVFAARPGTPEWSPVVRVRDFVLPAGKKASDYTELCYSADTCPANAIDMKTLPAASTGLLFVVAANP